MGSGITVDEAVGITLGLPEVTRRPYGDDAIGFRVRDKGFAYLNEARGTATVKAELDEHEALVRGRPDVFSPAWRSGRFAWVRVALSGVERDEFAELVTEAWRLTAPKRLAAAYDG